MTGPGAWLDALQALALFVADPVQLGGISLRAGAGPVRDRYLSLLQANLAPGTPVRRLPLRIGDDRLLGGLDLAATLQSGRPMVQRGLLAEADGGIVLLTMAERIEAGTASKLQAAMDNHVLALQRDGVSQTASTCFGVVALDEGIELEERPPLSLLDRMAFHLDLTGVSLADMADSSLWAHAGIIASADATAARDVREENPSIWKDRTEKTSSAAVADAGIEILCQTAWTLGIDSVRAPLLALRTARTAARLSGREQVNENDLAIAARLVLVPRATQLPPSAETEEEPEVASEPADAPPTEQPETPQKAVEDVVLEAVKAALPDDLLARLSAEDSSRGRVRASGRVGQFKTSIKRGRPIGVRPGAPKNGAKLHLLETLKAAAPWQRLRHHSGRLSIQREDFRIVRFRQRVGTTTIFAVDASGSAAMHRLAEAKGAVELLLADCYVRRDQVALLAFRGNGASLLLPPTGSLLRAKRSLAGLPGGGPTPLAAGIQAAQILADNIRRGGRTPMITLLTDARANIALDGTAGRSLAESHALETARSVRAAGIAALLIDTAQRPNAFARRLAEELAARYLPLPYADATSLSRAVRSVAAS